MGKAKVITLAVVFGLALIVLLQNTQVVTFRVLFWDLSMSRIIFLPLLVIIGFVIGFFMGKKSMY